MEENFDITRIYKKNESLLSIFDEREGFLYLENTYICNSDESIEKIAYNLLCLVVRNRKNFGNLDKNLKHIVQPEFLLSIINNSKNKVDEKVDEEIQKIKKIIGEISIEEPITRNEANKIVSSIF